MSKGVCNKIMSHTCFIFLPNTSPYHYNIDSNSVHHDIHFMLAISIINNSILYLHKVHPELSFLEPYLVYFLGFTRIFHRL